MVKKAFVVLLVACGFILGLAAVSYFLGAKNVLASSMQIDYGEGFVWGQALNITHNLPLYKDVGLEPLISVCYTPLFFAVSGLLMKVFGSYLAVGRSVAFVSNLVVVVGVVGIIWTLTKSKVGAAIGGIVGGLLIFTIPIVRYWTMLNRVDMLALCLTILGLWVAIRFKDDKRVLWSIPLFALSYLAKQSYVSGAGAIGLYLLVKNRRLLLWFVGSYVLLTAGSFLLGNVLTHGNMFLDVFRRGDSAPMWIEQGVVIMRQTAQYMPYVLCLNLIFLSLWIFKKVQFSIPIAFWLVSLPVAWVVASRRGAFENSALEFVVASCLLVGLLAGKAIDWFKEDKVRILGPVALAIPILVTAQGLQTFRWVTDYGAGVADTYSKVEAYVRSEPGPIISENAVFLLNENRPVLWEPSMIVNVGLVYRKPPIGWDQTNFVQKLNSGYYRMLILDYDIAEYYKDGSWSHQMAHERLTDQMAAAVRDHFTIEYHSGPLSQVPQGVWVYVYGN